jgi:hypothetical protein
MPQIRYESAIEVDERLIHILPQPCCVCKDEKASRDECMLFSTAQDPQRECEGMVEKYRSCMRGFGFQIA